MKKDEKLNTGNPYKMTKSMKKLQDEILNKKGNEDERLTSRGITEQVVKADPNKAKSDKIKSDKAEPKTKQDDSKKSLEPIPKNKKNPRKSVKTKETPKDEPKVEEKKRTKPKPGMDEPTNDGKNISGVIAYTSNGGKTLYVKHYVKQKNSASKLEFTEDITHAKVWNTLYAAVDYITKKIEGGTKGFTLDHK